MRRILLMLVFIPFAAACELRPLYVNDNSVEVSFLLPGRTFSAEPLVCVRSYSTSTGTHATSDFVPLSGGRASIPAGERTLVAHIFGSETVVMEDEASAESVRIRTNPADEFRQEAFSVALKMAGMEAEMFAMTVCNTPDPYYVGTDSCNIPFRIEGDETYAVTLPLEDITHTCIVRMTGITGLDYVSTAEVFLTGCRTELRLDGGKTDGTCAVASFAGRVSGTDDICVALRCLGRGAEDMTLCLLVTDVSGGRYAWKTGVGRLIEDGTAVFDASSLMIAEPTVTGGGFRPTLNDWDEDLYDIYL